MTYSSLWKVMWFAQNHKMEQRAWVPSPAFLLFCSLYCWGGSSELQASLGPLLLPVPFLSGVRLQHFPAGNMSSRRVIVDRGCGTTWTQRGGEGISYQLLVSSSGRLSEEELRLGAVQCQAGFYAEKVVLFLFRIYFYSQSQLQLSVFLLFVISSCGKFGEFFFF